MTAIMILVLLLSVAVQGIALPVSPVRPAPSSAVQTDAPGAESPEQIISLVRQYDYSERMTEESAERMIAACTLLYDHAEQWAETYHLSAKAASCEALAKRAFVRFRITKEYDSARDDCDRVLMSEELNDWAVKNAVNAWIPLCVTRAGIDMMNGEYGLVVDRLDSFFVSIEANKDAVISAPANTDRNGWTWTWFIHNASAMRVTAKQYLRDDWPIFFQDAGDQDAIARFFSIPATIYSFQDIQYDLMRRVGWTYLLERGRYAEAYEGFGQLLNSEMPEGRDEQVRIYLYYGIARMYTLLDSESPDAALEDALQWIDRAMECNEDIASPAVINALWWKAYVQVHLGDIEGVYTTCERLNQAFAMKAPADSNQYIISGCVTYLLSQLRAPD